MGTLVVGVPSEIKDNEKRVPNEPLVERAVVSDACGCGGDALAPRSDQG